MYRYSIDTKKDITTPDGDVIKDLTTSIFTKSATGIQDYDIMRMTDYYEMRPDLVSLAVFDNTDSTEFILKFTGVSNPFTLDKDDVLLIPNETEARGMMAYESDGIDEDTQAAVEAQIRNFYKFSNQEYKSDSTSYDNLAKMDIPSGNIDPTKNVNYTVPYISEDGRTAVIVRNGRMYFGEDSGIPSALTAGTSTPNDIKNAVQEAVNQSLTALSETNCLYNGMTLADFNRATNKNR